jgi:hypothetical protein
LAAAAAAAAAQQEVFYFYLKGPTGRRTSLFPD